MNGTDISMIVFCAVIVIAAIFGIVRIIKRNTEAIGSSSDLIDYLTSDEAKDKLINEIIPKLTESVLEGFINTSVNYETFKLKVVDDFTDKIYVFIEDHIDEFNISESLKKFITRDSIFVVCDKIFELDEVNTILNSCYTNYISKSISIAEVEEKNALDNIMEIEKIHGVEPEDEDPELHEIEKTENDTDVDDFVDQEPIIPADTTEVVED